MVEHYFTETRLDKLIKTPLSDTHLKKIPGKYLEIIMYPDLANSVRLSSYYPAHAIIAYINC